MPDIWVDAAERAEAAEHKPGMTPYRRGLGKLFVEPLTAVIAAKLEEQSHLPHGRLGTLLKEAEPRALAIAALEAVVPQIGRPRRRVDNRSFERALKEHIGQIFYANVQISADKKTARRQRQILKGKLASYRHETLDAWRARLRRTRFAIWKSLTAKVSRRDHIHAGAWLLACVVQADIVVLVGKELLPVARFREDISRLQRLIVRANAQLLPQREIPTPWTKPEVYRSGLRVNLLPHWNPELRVKIADSFRSERFQQLHLGALRNLESVELQVDDWTLDLVRRYAGSIKSYKDADRRVADENLIARDLKTAEMLSHRGRFRNGYHLDFRGRVFADENFNYAQQDRIRSLIRFAYGAELGWDGLRWLKIHAANTHGEDKISYDDRVKWAEQHRHRIARVAADPAASFDFWSRADKPFAFAAACRELTRGWTNLGITTNLPLAFDHTASGIQHLALIGLDEKAAPLVNLVKSDAPRDIYGELAKRTLELFDDSPAADFWHQYLDDDRKARKLLKTPGMTFSYAATSRGNIGQVYDGFEEAYPDEKLPEFDQMRYLVDRFRQACREILPGPVQIMEYIHGVVEECNKRKRFLEWTSNSGVLISNLYRKKNQPVVYTLDGAQHIVSEGIIPNTIDKRKTKGSAAANFVHSLDASHLARTVNELAANEMPALCVHDSFSVLAPHAEQFHITNREELALMYHEIFEAGGPLVQWWDILEPLPTGKFNIWAVQQATYACS